MSQQLNKKVVNATKWSMVTEIAAKLVAPVSTMVLARLLTPDAFGVLVTATMIISFAEIFTDAGFQKYLVQHSFDSDDSLHQSANVAFWSNLGLSLIIWFFICLFSSEIAHTVGNDGHGLVIAVSCVCIPLEAFSSIQMAIFRRALDFKTLFKVRMIGVLIPLIVTIPLAFLTRSYWSLIIGMIALNLSNAVMLTVKSDWKPKLYYSYIRFREMFAFSMWSMIEAVSIWLTSYLDIFIIGSVLTTYYMGIYRTGINTVNQFMGLITAATTSVMFSALSRLQDDEDEFKKLFFKFQKTVGLFLIPIGIFIFLFRDLITFLFLGNQWSESSYILGLWGLTSSVTIVLSHYCSEVYRAKGKPKYSVLSQTIHLMFLIPTVLITVRYGFETLCLSRSLVRLTLVAVNLIILYALTKITPLQMLNNIMHSIIAGLTTIALFYILPHTESTIVECIYLLLCTLLYIIAICIFSEERTLLMNFLKLLRKK